MPSDSASFCSLMKITTKRKNMQNSTLKTETYWYFIFSNLSVEISKQKKKGKKENIPWEDHVERARGLESRRSLMLARDVAEKSDEVLNSFICKKLFVPNYIIFQFSANENLRKCKNMGGEIITKKIYGENFVDNLPNWVHCQMDHPIQCVPRV